MIAQAEPRVEQSGTSGGALCQDKILSGSSDGATAILNLEGRMEGEKVRGEITLVKEGEVWLATKTSWSKNPVTRSESQRDFLSLVCK